MPVKVRSMVGIIPMLTAAVIDEGMLSQAVTVGKQFAGFLDRHGLLATLTTSSAKPA